MGKPDMDARMLPEPPFGSVLPFVALNVVSALLCAAAHNHLYFMLGLTTFAFHFMHYFFCFIALIVPYALGKVSDANASSVQIREFYGIAVLQFLISFSTGVIHSGGKDGALYTIRLADAGVTIIVILMAQKFIEKKSQPLPSNRLLLIFMAVGSSVAWLEPGILDYSARALLCVPVLSVAHAFHILLVYQKFQKLKMSLEVFLMYISGLASVLLIGPAIFFTTDSFNKDLLGIASAWEIIDYVLLLMAFSFMVSLTYSKYWLMTNLTPESYLVFRHFKFNLAALGQWFAHDLAYANFLSSLGRIAGCGSLLVYGLKRRYQKKTTETTSCQSV